jgi:hypothetical protein
MARPARHKIELSDEERVELVRIARAEKRQWQQVQRARARALRCRRVA